METVTFIITVRSHEPPPEWVDKVEKRLAREIELMFGENATVERQ